MADKKNKVKKEKKVKKDLNSNADKNSLFSDKELEEIKQKLLEMRAQVINNLREKAKYDMVENDIGDQIDEASISLEKEVFFELSDSERQNLENIEAALRKIENKKYGICESCNKPIDKKRLKVLPQSRFCISCQLIDEKYR